MAYLLDTSVAIALRDDHITTVDRVAALSVRPALSALSKVELVGGVHAQPHLMARRQQGLDDLLAILPVIDFTSDMAGIYGRIVGELGFSRRQIIDRMIAATAMSCQLTLITFNGADFTGISGLKLEAWDID